MRDILMRCAQLAYLMPEDANMLEQDVLEMISMVDKISDVHDSVCDDEYAMDVSALREDIPLEDTCGKELFRNAARTEGGCLCVPHMSGV